MSDFGDIMQDKCLNFAVRVVNLCDFLNKEKSEFKIADQLYRSGTSIGANYSEAQCAISKNDFIAKVYISLKECNESLFWLQLLRRTNKLTPSQFDSIYQDCEELKRLLTTITKSSRKNL
ncbi:MAG: four helix bundle protein [Prevotella sp.]|nr:four helix bundle protein [Prevotella sp.]